MCIRDRDCDPAHDITCVGGLCLDAGLKCNTHEDCVPWATNLIETCTQDTDCLYFVLYGDLCMNVGGTGLCVTVPFADFCAFGEPTVAGKFGSSDTATVCLDLSGRCDAHKCFRGCTSDPDFCANASSSAKRGPDCDTVTGKCGGCTGDGDCGGPGTSHCNVATGVCGCQVESDCAGLSGAGLDTCVAGKCSCSESSCSTFPNATPVCG